MYNINNTSNTIQFDAKSQSKKDNHWNAFFQRWQNGELDYDMLTDEEKEYVKKHDATYKNVFL